MTKEEIIEISRQYEEAALYLGEQFRAYRQLRPKEYSGFGPADRGPIVDREFIVEHEYHGGTGILIDKLLRTPDEMKADYEKELADKAEAEKQRLVDYETKRIAERRKLYEKLKAEFEGSEE